MDERLLCRRFGHKCVAIGNQIFVIDGVDGELSIVDVFDIETMQIVSGPDVRPDSWIKAAVAVNNKLLVFSRRSVL